MRDRIAHVLEWQAKNLDHLEELKQAERKRNNDYAKLPHMKKASRKWRLMKTRTDPAYRIVNNLRSRLKLALDGKLKHASTLTLLGCSGKALKAHLESL